jgi:hypothetical protein
VLSWQFFLNIETGDINKPASTLADRNGEEIPHFKPALKSCLTVA